MRIYEAEKTPPRKRAKSGGRSKPPKSPRRGRRRWLRALAWSLGILVLLGAAGAGFAYWYANRVAGDITKPKNSADASAKKSLAVVKSGEPFNVLVLGTDHRATDGGGLGRSDTIILMHVDPQKKVMSQLSISRDLIVNVPGHGQQMINAAYPEGGSSLTLQTIKDLTGIQINYVVEVDFKGFVQAVDALGGVFMDVDRRYFISTAQTAITPIDLQPGYQRLSGRQALAFARYRHTDTDLLRNARQQAFLRDIRARFSSTSLPTKIPQLLKIVRSNLTVLAPDGHSPDALGLVNLAQQMESVPRSATVQIKPTYSQDPQNANRVLLSATELANAMASFSNPDPTLGGRAAAVDAGGVAKSTAGAPATPTATYDAAKVTVDVRNGSGTPGTASDGAAALRSNGWPLATANANADSSNYLNSKIWYCTDPGAQAAATALSKQIPDAGAPEPLTPAVRQKVRGTTDQPTSACVLVVVGQAFDPTAVAAPAQQQIATPTTKSTLSTDTKRDRPLYVALQKQARFPLYLPTRLPTGTITGDPYPAFKSNPAGRAYRIQPTKFMGVNVEYYAYDFNPGSRGVFDIQETNWPAKSIPALASPTSVRVIGGRPYQLFYNGSQLHRVAFTVGSTTISVVNSLVDLVPNDAMVGIARSFQPVG